MKMTKKIKNIFLLLTILGQGHLYCLDIMGAYIKTKWVSGFTYSISVTLFTDASININRPTIPVDFGDATFGSYTLTNSTSGNGVNIKTYSGIHTYSGYGMYKASYLDTFRVANIKNILNSKTQQIYVEAKIFINQFSGPSSAPPITFYPPTSLTVGGNQVYYNPGCADPDGDSLSYSLVNCFATNYYLPNGAALNNVTGTFNFSKDSIGLYAFSYKINEWRKDLSNVYNIVGTSQLDFIMNITANIGINEIKDEILNVLIYPNPVSNTLHISTSQNTTEYFTIEINNYLGQSVLKLPFTKDFDISNLPNGYYILTLISKDKIINRTKFIKCD